MAWKVLISPVDTSVPSKLQPSSQRTLTEGEVSLYG